LVTIRASILNGGGTLPKSAGLNAMVLLDVSSNQFDVVEWEVLSTPKNSSALIQSQMKSMTRYGLLDKYGVYLIKVTLDRQGINPRTGYYAINVPRSVNPVPPTPEYLPQGGRVMNFSFELPGILAGLAAQWNLKDDGNILAQYAGVSRGRIKPVNYNPPRGEYTMCLGDDLGRSCSTIQLEDVFEVSQDIDLTGMTVLKLNLKYIKA
jgi:hypothetical protein